VIPPNGLQLVTKVGADVGSLLSADRPSRHCFRRHFNSAMIYAVCRIFRETFHLYGPRTVDWPRLSREALSTLCGVRSSSKSADNLPLRGTARARAITWTVIRCTNYETTNKFIDSSRSVAQHAALISLSSSHPYPSVQHVGGAFPQGARRAIRYGDRWIPTALGDLFAEIPEFQKIARDGGRDPASLEITSFGLAELHALR
jgi:hypothetical protein